MADYAKKLEDARDAMGLVLTYTQANAAAPAEAAPIRPGGSGGAWLPISCSWGQPATGSSASSVNREMYRCL
jgi:hypothetical protein